METHDYDRLELLSYFTGDCEALKAQAISRHVSSCAACQSYLNDLESEKSAFLKTHPYSESAFPPAPVIKKHPFRTWQIYSLAASVVLCVTTGVFLFAGRDDASYRIKGDAGLKIFVKNSTGAIETRGNGIYQTGEKIQFLYSCGPKSHLILLSIDSGGSITQYYPFEGDSSFALEPGQDIPLPNSILLDDYAGKELFLAVFSDKPLQVSTVRDRVKAEFARSGNLDSISVSGKGVLAVREVLSIRKGAR